VSFLTAEQADWSADWSATVPVALSQFALRAQASETLALQSTRSSRVRAGPRFSFSRPPLRRDVDSINLSGRSKLMALLTDDSVGALSQSITLRRVAADDETFLLKLFGSTREEFKILASAELEALVRMQFTLRQQQYRNGYPNAEDQLIIRDGQPVGRIFINEGEEELTLVDIALLPEYRNRGIGNFLLDQLLTRATSAKKTVRLQVFNSNPARRLYERLGFAEIGRDSMYIEMRYESDRKA
jgi:ribosomal protein S18 acetylase RimI-like enzyme